jgi:tetratricopeptide (TPR) repeat protein
MTVNELLDLAENEPDNDKKISLWTKAVELEPNSYEIYVGLAFIKLELGRYSDALEDVGKSINLRKHEQRPEALEYAQPIQLQLFSFLSNGNIEGLWRLFKRFRVYNPFKD